MKKNSFSYLSSDSFTVDAIISKNMLSYVKVTQHSSQSTTQLKIELRSGDCLCEHLCQLADMVVVGHLFQEASNHYFFKQLLSLFIYVIKIRQLEQCLSRYLTGVYELDSSCSIGKETHQERVSKCLVSDNVATSSMISISPTH